MAGSGSGSKGAGKSVVVAYVCWLFGGMFGLHLFYLRRDAQGFLTWSTLGGYGLGWLADITKIPRYVKEVNEDPELMREIYRKMREHRKPPFSISRFISAIMIGYLWGQLVMIAIPESPIANYELTFLHWFIPLGCSIGVWVVGNIGRETGKPWIAIGSAYLAYLSRYLYYDESVWFSLMLVTSALAFDTFSKEWRPHKKEERSFMMRMAIVSACGLLYLSLWGCYFYFNGKITDSNGDTVPLHEAVHHFFTSPWWTDLKQSLYDTYVFAQHHGWYEVYKQIIDLSDVTGEQNAYKVLGVGPTASQSEITARWRSLSREFHPDKIKDPAKQREAQEKFMEIQQAYEIISNIKTKRKRKNKQYEVYKQIIDLSDVTGEQNAYKVLGVGPTASQSEITARWRSLSREFHPDKIKDPAKQREAQEKFMEIQQAYEIISNIKTKRKRKNKQSVRD
ncbi:DnaJ domain [Popillia japonica]|uniref:DnaJ homolog subfamily C member 22 n=1 Tax=Popillia japonica TaxID=7064 RepID=A0AAW1JCK3_POPJA